MFDPYHRWLGIPPGPRPPNHYLLLGVSPGESDPDVIAEMARARAFHLQTHKNGPQADLCEILLDEVETARTTLLDPERRRAYDGAMAQNASTLITRVKPIPVRANPPNSTQPIVPAPRLQASRRAWFFAAWVLGLGTVVVAAIVLFSFFGDGTPTPKVVEDGGKKVDSVEPKPAEKPPVKKPVEPVKAGPEVPIAIAANLYRVAEFSIPLDGVEGDHQGVYFSDPAFRKALVVSYFAATKRHQASWIDLDERKVVAKAPLASPDIASPHRDFSPDGRLYAQYHGTADIHFWSLDEGTEWKKSLPVRNHGGFYFLPGDRFCTVDAQGEVTIYGLSDLEVQQTIPRGKSPASLALREPGGLAISPDRRFLATAQKDTIRIVDTHQRKAAAETEPLPPVAGRHQIRDIAFAPDSQTFAVVEDASRTVFVYSSTTGKLEQSFPVAPEWSEKGLTSARLRWFRPGVLGFASQPFVRSMWFVSLQKTDEHFLAKKETHSLLPRYRFWDNRYWYVAGETPTSPAFLVAVSPALPANAKTFGFTPWGLVSP